MDDFKELLRDKMSRYILEKCREIEFYISSDNTPFDDDEIAGIIHCLGEIKEICDVVVRK